MREPTHEHDLFGRALVPDVLEDTLVEADPEILAADVPLPEPSYEMRERRQDEVERGKLLRRGSLAGDLTDEDPRAQAQCVQEPRVERVEILDVHDVGLEVLRLREHERTIPKPSESPVETNAPFARPRPLERSTVDDHLVRVVTQHAKEVRVRIARAEEPVHERTPLDVVGGLVETGPLGVVSVEEGRVVRVDDEYAHVVARVLR